MTNPLVEELQRKIAAEQALQIRAEGKTEGKAEALIQVLELRDFTIDEPLRHRITHATVAQLESWLAQAVTAEAITDVFQDD